MSNKWLDSGDREAPNSDGKVPKCTQMRGILCILGKMITLKISCEAHDWLWLAITWKVFGSKDSSIGRNLFAGFRLFSTQKCIVCCPGRQLCRLLVDALVEGFCAAWCHRWWNGVTATVYYSRRSQWNRSCQSQWNWCQWQWQPQQYFETPKVNCILSITTVPKWQPNYSNAPDQPAFIRHEYLCLHAHTQVSLL